VPLISLSGKNGSKFLLCLYFLTLFIANLLIFSAVWLFCLRSLVTQCPFFCFFQVFFTSLGLYPFRMFHTFQFFHHLKMFSLNFMNLSLSSFQESNSFFWFLIFLDFVAQGLDTCAQFPLTCLVASSCLESTFAKNSHLLSLSAL